ncbi:zinc finger protein 277 isoform X2 [Boleophthalmus pectinirostris]|uniref:zinc finger protein 277 isoform X2 n=1 Tax=Boleophthalmus pectinirostris TaxID=150288 RepID=UPI000A1C5954|nr:zinc finger protein 277 isoform X2 [Boleophthalmus pectinirostris]
MAARDRSVDHGADHGSVDLVKHSSDQDSILEPLCFPERPETSPCPGSALDRPCPGVDWTGLDHPSSELLVCLFCPESLSSHQKDVLLKHLLLQHKLVIADVKLIADLPQYLLYWKGRFLEQPVEDFCSVIKTNSQGPVEKQEEYYLLCDVLPEDRVLRERLQQKRLEDVLEQQQREREDTSFHRPCMFCSDEFTGNRSSLLNHMAKEHSFSIGLPDNIVYCNQFLDTLQNKLDSLQCLYCEKTFRDKTTLKDHMRKKSHRRINSNNREYDRFYIINYLELGKTWEEVQSEDDRELVDDGDDDWSDWQAHPVSAVCLFCEHQSETMDLIYSHMKDCHGFDLHKLRLDLSLHFYQQVKLVNFIRREIHQSRCYGCESRFESKQEVLQHLTSENHVMKLPPMSTWNQPQYYFPTYENDALLCTLSDSDEDGDGVPVIAEDISNLRAIKQNSVLNQLLKNRATCS